MGDNTTHLDALDVDIPRDGYNIGYGTDAPSWNELYRQAFQAVNQHVKQSGGAAVRTQYVTSTEELHAAFANLAPGDHIYITDVGAPYRTYKQLDVNASDVRITGEGRASLIKPRDDDGNMRSSIRIGADQHVERVIIENVAYHGNPEGRPNLNYNGGGIYVQDSKNTTIRNCDIRRTVPYHEHNQRNSGIIVDDTATDFKLINNFFREIGDRAIVAGGSYGVVANNYSEQGFDRMISTEDAHHLAIVNNHLKHNDIGSMIGLSAKQPINNVIVAGNTATGEHNTMVRINSVPYKANLLVANNIGDGTEANEPGILIDNARAHVTGNMLYGYPYAGIAADGPQASVVGNYVYDSGGPGIYLGHIDPHTDPDTEPIQTVVNGNTLRNNAANEAGGAEIHIEGKRPRVMNNNITGVRNGRSCFDNPNSTDAVVAWNVVPVGADLFSQKDSSTVTQGNIN